MRQYKVQPLDLMQYINTKYHEPFIHEYIEFDRQIDGDRLAEAIDRLMEIFPLLGCGYDKERNVYMENGLTALDLLAEDDGAEIDGLLSETPDIGRRSIKFTLCGNALVITVSHMLCDGVGFKQLIYSLCSLYNGKSAENTAIMDREFSQLLTGFSGGAGATAKMLLGMLGGYKNGKVYEREDGVSVRIVRRTLDADVMERAHTAAKLRGATLNDLFLAAYARAVAQLCGRSRINIPCTSDLRKYSNGRTGIGNFTGSYNLNVKIARGESFSDSLKKVSDKMKKQKSTQNDIAGPALLVSKYGHTSLEKFKKLYGGMNTGAYTDYTNLGIIDDKRLVFDGANVVNAVGYSGLNKAPCFQLAVSSFKGATTFSSIIKCGDAAYKTAERLTEEIASEIAFFARRAH